MPFQVSNVARAGAALAVVTNDDATGQLQMTVDGDDSELLDELTIPAGFVARAAAVQLWRAVQATDAITMT